MPIYEYTCAACGHNIEVLQKISDAPLIDCPACGMPELRKRVTAAAFRLKGTGWYETDFKNAGKKDKTKDSGKKDTAAAPGGDKKSGPKSDNGTKKNASVSNASASSGGSEN